MSVRTALGERMRRALARAGWELRPVDGYEHADLELRFRELYARCEAATMTSLERMYALYQAVGYAARAKVDGDIVECGVWRGGSSMLAALALIDADDTGRNLWLFDTFAGMPEPGERDRTVVGDGAFETWRRNEANGHNEWCYSPLEDVRSNIDSTGYPSERVHYVEGMVETTIPERAPDRIAVLRLDTDWYESTLHELQHLYPRLAPGGVLIVDDYGHWSGARQAVDEYFAAADAPILLNRIDYTGRIGVKPR